MNYIAIVVCAVLSMVIGSIWYGPLFGKKWMELMEIDMTKMDEEEKKECMKGMWKLYAGQFVLSLFQIFVLAWYVDMFRGMASGAHIAFSLFIAFVMPTVAGACMWGEKNTKTAWTKFFISSGAQLISLLVFGYILSVWV